MSQPLRSSISPLLELLRKTYPDAHCELEYSNPLELLMATILSAQCTDVRVNQVTRVLFARCSSALHYVETPLDALEKMIKPTGFYRAKARHLQGCARMLVEKFQGTVPDSLEALTSLPGVGRKTANVVLGDAFQKPAGIVVDTHVQRLAERLGLSKNRDPEKIEQDLMHLIPRENWTQISHWLIWHGRRRCAARKPDCTHCELRTLCPSATKDASQIGRKKSAKPASPKGRRAAAKVPAAPGAGSPGTRLGAPTSKAPRRPKKAS